MIVRVAMSNANPDFNFLEPDLTDQFVPARMR